MRARVSLNASNCARELLLVGTSVRHLARAACEGGLVAHVIDSFTDSDTRVLAASVAHLPHDGAYRPRGNELLALVATIQRQAGPMPIVLGSGLRSAARAGRAAGGGERACGVFGEHHASTARSDCLCRALAPLRRALPRNAPRQTGAHASVARQGGWRVRWRTRDPLRSVRVRCPGAVFSTLRARPLVCRSFSSPMARMRSFAAYLPTYAGVACRLTATRAR